MSEATLLSFIVALATIAFIFLAFKPLSRVINKALVEESQKIEKELAHALYLKEEAQSLLAEFQAKQAKVEEEAKAVIEDAEAKAATLIEQASADLDKDIERKLKLAEAKIAQTEANTIKAIQDNVVDVTMEAVRTILEDNLTAKDSDRLMEVAVEQVKGRIH